MVRSTVHGFRAKQLHDRTVIKRTDTQTDKEIIQRVRYSVFWANEL